MKFIRTFVLILIALGIIEQSSAQTVEFIVDGEACSGFIGKLASDSQKAYVFTAGHCLPGLLDTHFPAKNIIQNPKVPAKNFLVHHLRNSTQTSWVKVSLIEMPFFDESIFYPECRLYELGFTDEDIEVEYFRWHLNQRNLRIEWSALRGDLRTALLENNT